MLRAKNQTSISLFLCLSTGAGTPQFTEFKTVDSRSFDLAASVLEETKPTAAKATDDQSGSATPAESMSLDQARDYMLTLINRDRALFGAPPVILDPIANKAGQWHSDEMAAKLFNSHWHADGTKPPQRYTECGGFDYDMENSHGCGQSEGFEIKIAAEQTFTAEQIEDEEKTYFDELPPNDGHRKNILDPEHTHVGLGLTLIDIVYINSGTDNYRLTSSQEFVSRYGTYASSAEDLVYNVPYVLSGVLDHDLTVQSVQVLREDLPKPIELSLLRDRSVPIIHGHYTLAHEKVASGFPLPYLQRPDAKVTQAGDEFRIDLLPNSNWKPGLYYVLVWAKRSAEPGRNFPISMRTMVLVSTKN